MVNKIKITFLIFLVFSLFFGGCASQMKTGESPSAGFIRQGYVLLDKADYRGASKMFRKAVGFDPQNARAYRGLGLAYLGLEDYYRAEVFMRKALQLDNSMSDLWGYLGDIYIRKGDEKTAMEFFDRCPPDDPHYAELHFRLGKIRLDAGDKDLAKAEFEKSLTHTEFWGGYWGMGKLAELHNDWNSALNWYRKAEQKISNPQVYLSLGDAYYQLEHYVPAFYYYMLYLGDVGDKREIRDITNEFAEVMIASSHLNFETGHIIEVLRSRLFRFDFRYFGSGQRGGGMQLDKERRYLFHFGQKLFNLMVASQQVFIFQLEGIQRLGLHFDVFQIGYHCRVLPGHLGQALIIFCI